MVAAALACIDEFCAMADIVQYLRVKMEVIDNNFCLLQTAQALTVRSPMSPGPAPTRYTMPFFFSIRARILAQDEGGRQLRLQVVEEGMGNTIECSDSYGRGAAKDGYAERRKISLSQNNKACCIPDTDEDFKGVTVDISKAGMSLYIFSPCNIREGLHVRINDDLPLASTRGVVRWVRQVDQDLYRAELQFH